MGRRGGEGEEGHQRQQVQWVPPAVGLSCCRRQTRHSRSPSTSCAVLSCEHSVWGPQMDITATVTHQCPWVALEGNSDLPSALNEAYTTPKCTSSSPPSVRGRPHIHMLSSHRSANRKMATRTQVWYEMPGAITLELLC